MTPESALSHGLNRANIQSSCPSPITSLSTTLISVFTICHQHKLSISQSASKMSPLLNLYPSALLVLPPLFLLPDLLAKGEGTCCVYVYTYIPVFHFWKASLIYTGLILCPTDESLPFPTPGSRSSIRNHFFKVTFGYSTQKLLFLKFYL